MLLKARCRFDLVDIEGVLVEPVDVGAPYAAAGSHHQAVVADVAALALGVGVADTLAGHVDLLGGALDEVHPHGSEQVAQRRFHLMHVRLVEARTNAQFGLWREDADGDIATAVLVQQAGCAQGAPDTTKTCADNQNVLFHWLLHRKRLLCERGR
ncbi:hypothetical protein D9M71_530640 [compost metagenome]